MSKTDIFIYKVLKAKLFYILVVASRLRKRKWPTEGVTLVTQLVFCLVNLVALLILNAADKKNSKLFLWIGILVLTFASGLRNENVGVDTSAYIFSFNNNFPYSWQFPEVGFRFISMTLMSVFNNNTTFLLVIYAFVTNALILIRLWDFRDNCSYFYMVFFYLTVNYINTMNIMRQLIAIAIVFYATKFLQTKKYYIFVLFLLLATTIHSTALLGVAFLFVYIWENIPSKQKKYFGILGAILIPVIAYTIIVLEAEHIENYFSQRENDLNLTFFYRIVSFLIVISLQYARRQITFKEFKSKRYKITPLKWSDKETIFYIFGLGASSLGMFFSTLSRIGMYYLMYEIVFWGRAVKEGKSRQVALLLSLIYAVYIFALELFRNGSLIFPYGVHWF